jgi:hypothetical protein
VVLVVVVCLFDEVLFVFDGGACAFFFPFSLFVFFFFSDLLFQPFDAFAAAAAATLDDSLVYPKIESIY